MIALARLLIRDRYRNLNQHGGLVQYGSAGTMFVVMGWLGAASAAPIVRQAIAGQLEKWMIVLWAAWTWSAAASGKDLSWRIGLERLRVFPGLGFLRAYMLTFICAFLSLPLLFGFGLIQYWIWFRSGPRFLDAFAAFVGYFLFVSNVRLGGSLGRILLHFGQSLSSSSKRAPALLVLILAALTLLSFLHPFAAVPHPGRLLGQIISGEARAYPLIGLAFWILALLPIDFLLQRNLTYSSIQLTTPGSRLAPSHIMFALHPSRPGPGFRIGVLGWLRSRAAFMLFLWGAAYSFLWTAFSKMNDASGFFLFIFMNVFFHCYLRGNILGIDRGAAWLYYQVPIRIERIISSKSLSLTLLQGLMVAALFCAGLARARPGITPLDWLALFSYALCAIVLGEVCGFFFSILYPESIDRTSQFSGGATVGTIASGAVQFLFLILFQLILHYLKVTGSSGYYCALLLILPSCLYMIRTIVLKNWVHEAMWTKREEILNKLARF